MKRKESKVIGSLKEAQETKKTQTIINGVLAASVLGLVMTVAMEDTVAVVTPPQFSEELRVSQNQANEHYKVRWAFAAASLAGNVNDKNAQFVTEQLGLMLSPYLRDAILPTIRRQAQIVAARKAVQRFTIEDAVYEPKNDVVFIWGHRELQINKNDQPSKERWTYEFRIQPFTGRPAITHFDSYPGPPRSKDPKYKVEYNPTIADELQKAMETTNPEAPVAVNNDSLDALEKEANND